MLDPTSCADIGLDLDRRWRGVGYDELRFAALAADAAAATGAPDMVDFLARHHSRGTSGTRGEYSVTLFRTDRFRIEVAFAAVPSNAVIASGWNGAFKILDGRCLHVAARFDAARLAGWGIAVGELHLEQSSLLEAGAIVTLRADDIHAACPLDRPTAILSIRAPRPHAGDPAKLYYWPHFAIDGGPAQRSDKGRAAMLEFVAQIGQSGAFEAMLGRALARSTLRETIDMLMHPRVLHGDAARLDRIVAVAMERHPREAAALSATVREQRRRGEALVEAIRPGDPQARFVAALNATLSDRQAIAHHLADAFPQAEAA